MPKVTSENLLLAAIPRLVGSATDVGAWFRRSSEAIVIADALCEAASLLVESLIEGKVPESQLVLAQKKLETGDRTVDRALLGAMRRGGSNDSAPLFGHLDVLYALLDELDADRGKG